MLPDQILLSVYYDGDCPFCHNFVSVMRLKQTYNVRLIDLRDHDDHVARFQSLGYNLNHGMIVELNEHIYFADEAVHILGVLSAPGLRGTIFRVLFGSARISKLLYPFLKVGRNLTLRILRRSRLGASL